jgi:acetyltransferase EpsM
VPSPDQLVVVGGGEHARVVVEAARTRPDLWHVAGYAAPEPCEETGARLGLPWLGDDGACLREHGGCAFVLGLGGARGGRGRRAVAEAYRRAGVRWATVAHERAWVSPTASLGPGVVVGAGAVVNTGAVVREHALVNTGAVVEHDAVIGAFCHVGPGAVLGGGAVVGPDSFLGLGCRVRDHVELGAGVTVGMGAVVVRSAAGGLTLLGVPARPV